jgi:arylsulfatase A-like enzyme/Flp pilus assembly protein TadD
VRRLIPVLTVAFITVALVMTASRAATRPNVVLVTLDTTRADRMGFLGSTGTLTPALDALARDSLVFSRAYAQAPITTVSHATILSGTYPPYHGVTDFGVPLGPTVPYLPDLLRQAGYATGAFVGSLILDPRTGTAPGFDRGFDIYDAGFRLRRPGEDRYRTIERRGDEVVSRALDWITRVPAGRPYFAWIHLYDAHDPYDPPADLKSRFASNPYDGEVAGVDRQVGRVATALRSTGALANTVFVVTADHGESLGEHGERTHGVFLYEDTLRVPLLVRAPGVKPGRVTTRVRLVDVAPTILEAAQTAAPSTLQGASLLHTSEDRPVYAATEYPRRAFGWSPLVSWRNDRFLYVRAPRPELYDVVADPAETRDIAATRSRVVTGIDAELEKFVKTIASGATSTPGKAIDPAVAERLAALGYVSGPGSSAPPSGVDPKDRIGTANALQEAVVLVEDGAFEKALPLLEKVTATDPDIPIAQLQLGFARARQRQYARAIPPLRKAIALQPDVPMAHYELGVALYETGDLPGAAAQFETVTARMPKWTDARYSLGSVYARINRVDDAVRELRAAIGQEPRHPRANLLLGRILTLQGHAAAAVPHLQIAVEADPGSAEARKFLVEAQEKARRP